jgi:hypothetical protein
LKLAAVGLAYDYTRVGFQSSAFPETIIVADHEHRNAKTAAVVHNAAKQRFEMDVDGQLSVLEYTFKNHRLFLTHTEVPPALRDQGLATKLGHAGGTQ